MCVSNFFSLYGHCENPPSGLEGCLELVYQAEQPVPLCLRLGVFPIEVDAIQGVVVKELHHVLDKMAALLR